MGDTDILKRALRIGAVSRLYPIAGIFIAIFESELGDAEFAEVVDVFGNYALVLSLGPSRERQVLAVCAAEKKQLAVLHVFGIGLDHARGRTSLR